MTYASYLGARHRHGATEAHVGSSPQSYMMYDIAALQAIYGANFGKVGTSATYRWDDDHRPADASTASPAPNTGVTATKQDLLDSVDAGRRRDLRPQQLRRGPGRRPAAGPLADDSPHDQLADLNSNAAAGTPQFHAQGNIYNALLYNGDRARLIEQPDHRQRQRQDDRQRPPTT